QLDCEVCDPGHVITRAVEARDEAEPDRIIAGIEDNRDLRGCRFCGECRSVARDGSDHRWPKLDKLGRERGQPREVVVSPAKHDCEVPIFHERHILQPLSKCGYKCRVCVRHSGAEVTYDWQGGLRPRSQRPCRSGASEQRDELAPAHSITSSARASKVAGSSRPIAFAVTR